MLRLSAFNQRTTPEIEAEITRIAADASRDTQTGMTYYVIRAMVSEPEMKKLAGLTLSPGMPVEAFVTTESRSAFTYFAKPLMDAMHRSYRER